MPEYYISSTKCTIQERQTKRNGKVYDVVFRIVTLDGEEKQKKLSGFKTKSAAKAAHAQFVTEKCELVKNNPLKKKKTAAEQTVPTVGDLFEEYLKSIDGQVKYSSIYDKEQTFKRWILPKYQNVPIAALTREELYKWQDELWAERNERTGERYGYEYLSKIRAHFSSFLSWTESRKGFRNEFEGGYTPQKTREQERPPYGQGRNSRRLLRLWTILYTRHSLRRRSSRDEERENCLPCGELTLTKGRKRCLYSTPEKSTHLSTKTMCAFLNEMRLRRFANEAAFGKGGAKDVSLRQMRLHSPPTVH